jgi:hypothetical protein
MLVNLNQNSSVNIAEDTRGAKTTTTVSATTTAAVALPANASRAAYSIYNAGTTTVYFREGATVTSALYEMPIPPGFAWIENFPSGTRYLGAVSVITATGTASLMVSEGSLI